MIEQQHKDPVTRPLRVVTAPVITAPVTAPPGSSEDPVTAGAVVPMGTTERAGNAMRDWADTAARIAVEAWAPCGRFLDRLWHPEPETMAQHRTYIRSREWVAPGITGKWATAIAWAGILYHAFIAQPVKYAMKAVVKVALNVKRAAQRPLRFALLAVFITVLILIVPF